MSDDELELLSSDNKETLPQIIIVLAEVCLVARKSESDERVTMSQTPRYTHELYETLITMNGKYKEDEERQT